MHFSTEILHCAIVYAVNVFVAAEACKTNTTK